MVVTRAYNMFDPQKTLAGMGERGGGVQPLIVGIWLGLLMGLSGEGIAWSQTAASPIAEALQQAWQQVGIATHQRCSDEVFVRRLWLDLLGRIPTLAEREAFLRDPRRDVWIDRLLHQGEWCHHWAEWFTTQWYGLLEEPGDRGLFSAWLTEQLRQQIPYDRIVQEILRAEGESAFVGPVNFYVHHIDDVVVPISRAFLGIRLDCARCHDHPFDRWKQADYESFHRFFSGMRREDVSPGNVRLYDESVWDVTSRPRFLSGAEPRTSRWRAELALMLTRSRPFARHYVNNIWYLLMGRGLVHPIDDVRPGNPPVFPEFFEKLTDLALAQQFHVASLLRVLLNSPAYQAPSEPDPRESAEARQRRRRFFALKPLKPLTADQWYASLCVALEHTPSYEERMFVRRSFYGDDPAGLRLSLWEDQAPLPGVMQRLTHPWPIRHEPCEQVFLRCLGRPPSEDERQLLQDLSAADAWFVLLHSSEFHLCR
ncbi:MAG: hypothetical protein KatS3mg114_1185 [Planctomycetaceae bacterium]|nr:MAG: hypothetical protein KatS3mg114_1185 [Planctomycetaceae bacterium]